MEQNLHPQTALDRMVTTEQGQLLKAALPFLPPAGARMLSIYTKFSELRNTLALFPENAPEVSICDTSREFQSPLEFIQEIRPYCSGETGNKMDGLIHMMVMVQMLQLFQDI